MNRRVKLILGPCSQMRSDDAVGHDLVQGGVQVGARGDHLAQGDRVACDLVAVA